MPTRRLGTRRFRTAIIRPPAGTDWRARLAAADAEMAADYREARAPSAAWPDRAPDCVPIAPTELASTSSGQG